MSLIEESFKLLYGTELGKQAFVRYSGKFKPYNANVRISPTSLVFNLSREWKNVDEQIRIGLIQNLLMKIYKKGKNTPNIDLYNSFIRHLGSFVPKIHSDPVLEQSFARINEKYFFNAVDRTNLKWGAETFSKLGSYSYQQDLITISSVFRNNPNLLDYVMYHEMLHKKHSFKSRKGRSYYHTSQFRNDERKFENSEIMEKQIKRFISGKRLKKVFRFF